MSKQRRVKHVPEAKRKARKAKRMSLRVNKLFDAGLDFIEYFRRRHAV